MCCVCAKLLNRPSRRTRLFRVRVCLLEFRYRALSTDPVSVVFAPSGTTMNRRNPTRIELKLDDLQEYEAMKKDMEEKNRASKEATAEAATSSTPLTSKAKCSHAPEKPTVSRVYRIPPMNSPTSHL